MKASPRRYLSRIKHRLSHIVTTRLMGRGRHPVIFAGRTIEIPFLNYYSFVWYNRYRDAPNGWHEASATKFIQENFAGECRFLDCGAHIGYFSLLIGAVPGNRALAVEFDPENFSTLKHMVSATRGLDGRIDLVNAALSSVDEGTVCVPLDGRHDAMKSLSGINEAKNCGTVEVPLRTIDSLCAEHHLAPNLVKIDVEGAEYDVLQGATAILRRYKPVIILEIHRPQLKAQSIETRAIYDMLEEMSYKLHCFGDHRSRTATALVPFNPDAESDNFDLVCLPGEE